MLLRRWYKFKTILKLDELGFMFDNANHLYFKENENYSINVKIYGCDLDVEIRRNNNIKANYIVLDIKNYKNIDIIIQEQNAIKDIN
jgi:hypothetical protein